MPSREHAANSLWEAGNNSGHANGTKEWWLALADRALAIHAEQLVEQHLGGQEVSGSETLTPSQPADTVDENGASVEADRQASLPEPVGPRQAAERVGFSQRAQTNVSFPLTRDFRPSKFGYTLDHLSRDYPHVDTSTILEAFLSHYIAKGQTSKNWLEMFFGFAATNERFVKERQAGKTDTDSMGQPLDPGVRVARVRAAREHAAQNDSWIDQQIAAQEAADRESNQ